jgi:hypothetical protein
MRIVRGITTDAVLLAGEVLALEERFDERLGPHTRRLAYWHLLPHKALTCAVMSAPALPVHERALVTPGLSAR